VHTLKIDPVDNSVCRAWFREGSVRFQDSPTTELFRKGHNGGTYSWLDLGRQHLSLEEVILRILGDDFQGDLQQAQTMLISEGHCIEIEQIKMLARCGKIVESTKTKLFFIEENYGGTVLPVYVRRSDVENRWHINIGSLRLDPVSFYWMVLVRDPNVTASS